MFGALLIMKLNYQKYSTGILLDGQMDIVFIQQKKNC
jgi:hypothetical protein